MAKVEQEAASNAGFGASKAAPGAHWALFLLLIIFTLNFLDRQIVTILGAPIKAELKLDNTEFGLISGLAFALFYTTLGLPIAYLADRFNRVWILSASCVVWSAMTALCGAAQNFQQMFVARVGVGVGEAGCVPASHALIADLFPPEKRPGALAVFAMGIPLGSLIGLAVGGYVAQHFGWRMAFLVVGLPGILFALLALFTIKDPKEAAPGPPQRPKTKVLGLLANRSYVHLTLGAAIASASGYGLLAFIGIYVAGRFQMGLAEIGLALGLAVGSAGALGSLSGGGLANLARADRARMAPAALALVLAALILPFALLTEERLVCFGLLFVVSFFNAFWYGPTFAGVQGLAAPQERAMAAAMFTFATNAIGLGLGPLFVGIVADGLEKSKILADFSDASGALAIAMMAAGALNLWAAAHFALAFSGKKPARPD